MFSTEADVQGFVNNGLTDATTICNIIIAKIAEKNGTSRKIELEVRAESRLFSNIVDHVVVYDYYSDIPVLAVETKKFLDSKCTAGGSTNKLLGQGLDQLLAMKLMGHPSPFGIITCHNSSHITWLDSPAHNKIVEIQNHNAFLPNRLVNIVTPLPATSTSNKKDAQSQSQSPIKIDKPDACTPRTVSISPESKHASEQAYSFDRALVISKRSYNHDENVDVYINAIFCSLDSFYRPRTIISLEKNERVDVESAIGMTEAEYSWDKVETTYRGPLTHNRREKNNASKLYLISYIGRGATSKVYRCITGDGYGCVAKIYVQRRFSDHTVMTEEEFMKSSDSQAAEELANFQNIYDTTLNEFIWRGKLNNLHCLFMPFFEPIEKEKRKSRAVKLGIRATLDKFSKKEKKFKKCDQLWRHVGRFNNQIYLFDLGDLIGIAAVDDSDDRNKERYSDNINQAHNALNRTEAIDDHMAQLLSRACA